MSRTIELPDDVYRNLEAAAQQRGLSVADWIAEALPQAPKPDDERPTIELLKGYIGTVDSSKHTPDPRYRTPFSEIVAEKLRRQGFRIP